MTVRSTVGTRLAAAAFAAAGALFVLYPVLRPWQDETTADGALAAMGSAAWIASHSFAMAGFVLVGLGLLGLWRLLVDRTALAAVIAFWCGAGLTLPYYGAETFGLYALAGQASAGEPMDVLATVDAVRFQPVAVASFGVGLVLLGIGAVLAAVGIWRSGLLPQFSGILFAVGFALFLPQFFTPPAVRIGHGILLGVGLVWLAVGLARSAPAPSR